jgi:hypothetical protein
MYHTGRLTNEQIVVQFDVIEVTAVPEIYHFKSPIINNDWAVSISEGLSPRQMPKTMKQDGLRVL